MARRPHFRSNINELEKLFESSKDDVNMLRALHDELKHRVTNRARALRSMVEHLLRTKHGQAVKAPKSQGERGPAKAGATSTAPSPKGQPSLPSGGETVPKGHAAAPRHTTPPVTRSSNSWEDTNRSAAKDQHATSGAQLGASVTAQPLGQPISRRPMSPNSPSEPITYHGSDPILAAWLTLEVLTPQPMPNERELQAMRSQLVRLEEIPEPWRQQRFRSQGRERAVYWMVFLGELDLAKALASILKVFPDDAGDERAEVRGTTTLAVVVLDAHGRPVADKTFLSSFAWGYGKVRAGQLRELAEFVEAERAVKAELEKLLIRQNEDGEIQPLQPIDIDRAITWLTETLNLPADEVVRPGVAIRVPQWGWYNEAPEPELLNSFFIEELVRVRAAFREGDVGQALSAYMRGASTRERHDVVRNKAVLAEAVAPARIPLTRWPSPGRYSLVLMQQTAVNHAAAELASGGLVAVNGPPGTGKTTLLRDIVAKVVLDRAIALSQFDKPESAFTHVTTMRTGNAYSHLYQLHESLFGHEIVVASSNNKAVENISCQIPSSSAVASDLNPPLRYFQSISDAVAAGKGALVDGATWGLAAAVLGNAANRAAFVNSFWWHKRRGMALYLRAVTGGDLTEDDDKGEEDADEERVLDVVSIERPPRSEIEALRRWRTTRQDFLAKLESVQNFQKRAQEAYRAVCRRAEVAKQVEEANSLLTEATQAHGAGLDKHGIASRLHERALDAERKAAEDRAAIDRLRPGFFARLFWTRAYREWRYQMATAVEGVKRARMHAKAGAESVGRSEQEVLAAKQRVAHAEARKATADRMMSETLAAIEAGRSLVGANCADEIFWAQDDARLQTASPWGFDEFQRARDALFVAAFTLHRAFIDAAAKYLRHNIRAALDVMKGRSLSDKQEPARRSLWASLFLVVPVVSTTFASTARLFGSLEREQLGWLLIDEAGQTVPQAAVGALWRAQRALVIGDPLQIQPVVTTPPKLIKAIFAEYNVEVDEWAGPETSAQTLADRVSWFGTSIRTSDGDIWVGSPLRVHRRCEEPMFSISNHVAYDGLMVYGTLPGASPIGEILGDSIWINVNGDAVGKWSEAEGKVALQILRNLFEAGLKDPDIFFITPFRIVSYKLREMIRNDRWIADRLPVKAWEWTNDRVGTIHTFQGKEADTVVLVLGAPLDASAGARRWAGNPPNLLNVAVTRAKRRLYVVGNREAWRNAGSFTHLAQSLR